jgi:hypothetical protein
VLGGAAVSFYVVLPVRRCPVRDCGEAYVGIESRCGQCSLTIARKASLRDITNHKRLSLRRRLGLLADGDNA